MTGKVAALFAPIIKAAKLAAWPVEMCIRDRSEIASANVRKIVSDMNAALEAGVAETQGLSLIHI